MNIAFPLGLLICIVLLVFGIVFGQDSGYIAGFLNAPAFLIVVGGTAAALFASFPVRMTAKMFRHIPVILGLTKQDPAKTIKIIADLSYVARKQGLLSLEESVEEYDDVFLRDSVKLAVDAVDPVKTRMQLENELSVIEARHAQNWEIYDRGAALAPGFGMLGTLAGIIIMFGGLRFEEEGGMPFFSGSLSLAFAAVFYGILLVNLFFIPAASQLRAAHAEEMFCKELIIEGVIAIQAGENPRHIEEKLKTFLTQSERRKAEAAYDEEA
ncbi:MAG: MotA/TolQ/ExbB proton channel family protein [Oscillospiraceae bacterium]|nr:MotA/TolQ/ExbB proton channel family protein [Oscillospiraceae bacterium]